MAAPPFATQVELHRERVFTHASLCLHCQETALNGIGQPFLYNYFLASVESGRRIINLGLFCGEDCFDSYRHG